MVLHEYPFAWFGILAEAPRSLDVLIYANSEHGFALVSQRTETVRRMYFQCDPKEDVADWDDERIWTEFRKRVPEPGHPRHPRAVRRPRSLLLHRVHHAARLIQRPGLGTRVESPALLLLDDLHAAHRPGLRRLRARPPARRADMVVSSRHAQAHLAEAYTGWPAST